MQVASMTTWPGSWWLTLGLVGVVAAGVVAEPTRSGAQKQEANPDALVLVDYNRRIKQYLDLRKPLKEAAPPLKETNDPAKLTAAQQGLADKLRAARRDARPGDIFTPEIRTAFRKLLYPEVKGPEGRNTKEAIKEDAPPQQVRFKVNAMYPKAAPLPTVPPNVLANLPPLPDDLEYRIVEKHLILRDTQANIIVDFIPDAIR
jgi:hypothetical protein